MISVHSRARPLRQWPPRNHTREPSTWISCKRECHFSSSHSWTSAAPPYCKLLMHKITESSGPAHYVTYPYLKIDVQTDFLPFKLPGALGWQESLTVATDPEAAEPHKRIWPDLFLCVLYAHRQGDWLARSQIASWRQPACIHSTFIY